MVTNKPAWVVIPAAGVGKRMQAAKPKQYLMLHDKTVLEHTIRRFLGKAHIAGVVVVISANDAYWAALAPHFVTEHVHVVHGGAERADSVLNGLDYLAEQLAVARTDYVLVHDAARPCVPERDIKALLALRDQGEQGALLATPVRDTMKRALPTAAMEADTLPRVSHSETRSGLWHALTPQLAPLRRLRNALQSALQAGATITDEASALEFMQYQPILLEGDARNIKITRPADLELAAFFLQHTGFKADFNTDFQE